VLQRSRLLLLLPFALSSCGEWETVDEVMSPGERAIAIVDVHLVGAWGGNSTRITVNNMNGGTIIKPGEVVIARDVIDSETQVEWLSADRLAVRICEATRYDVRARLLRQPVVRSNGTMNEIIIDVRNMQYSEKLKKCV
jgi:hypothetical protein